MQHLLLMEHSIRAYSPSVLHTCGTVFCLLQAGPKLLRDLSVGSDGDGLSWRGRDSVPLLCTTEPVLNTPPKPQQGLLLNI